MIRKLHKDFARLPVLYWSSVSLLLALVIFVIWTTIPIPSTLIPVRSDVIQPVENMYDSSLFKDAQIEAKAYVIYDIVDKKIIAQRNSKLDLPLASLTKMMMAVTALDTHSATTTVTIHRASIDEGYDLGLREGQVWTLSELLKYTLVFSSNDGAQAIADEFGGHDAFVSQMNAKSNTLGLHMVFTEPSGLDKGSLLGGKGNAEDVAQLFAYARKEFPNIVDATSKVRVSFTASTGKIIGIPNTNQLIEQMFGSEGSKTGFTDEAGGNLAVITDVSLGHPVVIVVLGSTKEKRFSDVETLYRLTRKSIK